MPKTLTERELINKIRKEFSSKDARILTGIGDDAAVIRLGEKPLVVTKDLLVEDIHFLAKNHDPFQLGRKSLSVNLSDIAAMGCQPEYALLGLGLPERIPEKWIQEYLGGFKDVARGYGVSVVGGDITHAQKITISVTVFGEGDHIVLRSGAKPGDLIYVSGFLGDAAYGLELALQGYHLDDEVDDDIMYFLMALMSPLPEVSLGMELAKTGSVSGMIDTSDGLSIDLGHICEESGVGAEVVADSLPVSPALQDAFINPYEYVLHGGEDYKLLFTVPPDKQGSILELTPKYQLTQIGRITQAPGLFVMEFDGSKRKLEQKGYQHFR